jgi:hypothetical protein
MESPKHLTTLSAVKVGSPPSLFMPLHINYLVYKYLSLQIIQIAGITDGITSAIVASFLSYSLLSILTSCPGI